MRAVALLLSLDDEADTARELAGGVAQCLDGLDAVEELTLVVTHAAGVEAPLAQARLVRRRLPQIEWRGRLHVVMLDRYEGARPGPQLANHERRDALLAQHRDVRAGRAEPLLHPLRAAFQLRELIGLAGNGAEIPKLVDPSVEPFVAESIEAGKVRLHQSRPVSGNALGVMRGFSVTNVSPSSIGAAYRAPDCGRRTGGYR